MLHITCINMCVYIYIYVCLTSVQLVAMNAHETHAGTFTGTWKVEARQNWPNICIPKFVDSQPRQQICGLMKSRYRFRFCWSSAKSVTFNI